MVGVRTWVSSRAREDGCERREKQPETRAGPFHVSDLTPRSAHLSHAHALCPRPRPVLSSLPALHPLAQSSPSLSLARPLWYPASRHYRPQLSLASPTSALIARDLRWSCTHADIARIRRSGEGHLVDGSMAVVEVAMLVRRRSHCLHWSVSLTLCSLAGSYRRSARSFCCSPH